MQKFITIYANHQQITNTLINVLQFLSNKNGWCITGGCAVVVYVGRAHRIVSPDLDIIVSLPLLQELSKKYRLIKNELGVLSIDDCVDIIPAISKWQQEAIEKHVKIRYKDFIVPCIPFVYLMYNKFTVGRAKDLPDLHLLAKKASPEQLKLAKNLVTRFFPGMVEDFIQEVLYAKNS